VTPYFSDAGIEIFCGDSLELLREMPADSVQCCITSPPYWGLRDYGTGQWEGGSPDCEHKNNHGGQGATGERAGRGFTGEQNFYKDVCLQCGARRVDKQIGLERTPYEYVDSLVALFREVRRVLSPDGTLWLNLGDSYAAGAGAVGDCPGGGKQGEKWLGRDDSKGRGTPKRCDANGRGHAEGTGQTRYVGPMTQPNRLPIEGLKPKDLVGIPWRVAFALQADGWYLRSEIIWHKPNPKPESVQDRPTRAHEHLFLLSKSERYFYNAAAIAEPLSPDTHARYARGRSNKHKWADGWPGKQTIATNKPGSLFAPQELAACENGTALLPIGRAPGVNPKCAEPGSGVRANSDFSAAISRRDIEARNKRTVWTIPTQPFPEAHFATFPEDLVAPCIFAGTKRGDLVLDPFSGAATVAAVAKRNGCRYVGLELNPEYCEIAARRLRQSVFDFEEISS